MDRDIQLPQLQTPSLTPAVSAVSIDKHGSDDERPFNLNRELNREKRISPPPGPPVGGPSPPPNGGLQAWLHVAGGFSLFFNTWGILNAFGVYQTYYESGALFQKSSSDIAWIGAIQAFMVLLIGFFSGPIYDRGYLRALLIVGSFGIVFGHMMLSLCNNYWQVLLAQGFCVGIGAGCLFVPCVSILPTYFSTKIGLAIGLAASGSSLGGIIYPIVLYRLVGRIGFPWATRVLGFISLGTLIVPIFVMRMRFKPPKARSLIDYTAFSDIDYLVFTFASLVGFIAVAVLVFYISYYPTDEHFTDAEIGFYMVPIFNAASCFGRTLPNYVSDKIGPFNVLAPTSAVTGVLLLCFMTVKNQGGIITLALLSGFFSGTFIAMPPVCFAAMTKNKALIGTRIGMGFGFIGFAMIIGGVGGGKILGNVDPLHWHRLYTFGGVCPIGAAILYAGVRIHRTGFKLMVKG
ncbi:MAG: hypothetical protein Q9227_004855 [Pyrenula ochraceoflavens]